VLQGAVVERARVDRPGVEEIRAGTNGSHL
jgi:hypothetical protein